MSKHRPTFGTPSRRAVLQQSAAGFGWLALAALGAQQARAEQGKYRSPLAPKEPDYAARAKRVIFMFMAGGPSHLESFDWKPELARVGKGGHHQLLGPVVGFKPAGKSGLMISEVFPHLAEHADRLCILNGMKTNNAAHQQASVALHTGNEQFVRPSLGAWVTYGLGTVAEDLPGFITLNPINDNGGAQNYGSAFLPAMFQGTRMSGGQGAVPNLANRRLSDAEQRRQIEFIQQANRRMLNELPGQPELEGLIESYELAYKMQTSVPATLDLSGETDATRELYGVDDSETSSFGTQCLMARRLAEKGVRFIQLTSPGWDHHNNLREHFTRGATSIDKPIAGLITDLHQRGMLDETLLVWGGEFGRSSHDDKGDSNGRGHANRGYSMWFAGGGVRGGQRYGATDELGQNAVDGVMDTHDLHATTLHLLGLDHEGLTFRYAGRDFRLTDTKGKVHKGVMS
ncbi:MAG: DUF1501 domain-containing protein [Planctomycetaceae bacterium]|nr:DUF1501 domain-containing protein [Planctomycetaceae bacterium]